MEDFSNFVKVRYMWRYKLDDDYAVASEYLAGISFQNDWITIKGGVMLIRKAYAWDGCTPSLRIPIYIFLPKGIWLGIPDGPLGTDGRPTAWKASLFHDALCQYRDELYRHHVTKAKSVGLFRELLEVSQSPWWMLALYPWAVDKFGPQHWAQDADFETRLKAM